ncbi:hypothetical protein C27AD_05248 [Salinisphaera hydrothermalis C27AD]
MVCGAAVGAAADQRSMDDHLWRRPADHALANGLSFVHPRPTRNRPAMAAYGRRAQPFEPRSPRPIVGLRNKPRRG